MYILTNVSEDECGQVYAGKPDFFETEEAAISNARENLAEDFGISVDDIECKAQEGGTPYVLSMSRNGRFEAYTVSKIPEKCSVDKKIPLVTHYSFDFETPVSLFDTEEEALQELKTQFEEELRIQTEENEHVQGEDLEAVISPDSAWASITIYYDDQKDVIEWSIGSLRQRA